MYCTQAPLELNGDSLSATQFDTGIGSRPKNPARDNITQ